MEVERVNRNIDFDIPNRANLIKRTQPDTKVGGLSFGFDLMYTENSPHELHGNSAKWKELSDNYQDEVMKPIEELLTKFFDAHEEIMPVAFSSLVYTTDIDHFTGRIALLRSVRDLD